MKFLAMLMLALLLAGSAVAQGDLSAQLTRLQSLIGEVQVDTDSYDQRFSYDPEKPWRVILEVTETDKKGRSENRRYELNLALLDPRKVRWKDGNDRLALILESEEEPVVKVFEDGELDGYEDELSLLAKDMDNVRAIEDLLEVLLPMAKTEWEEATQLPDTYETLKAWVASRVGNVSVDDEDFLQEWKQDPEHAHRVIFRREEDDGKKSEEFIYQFNLADLSPKQVKMEVKGKEALINLQTDGRKKYIQVFEDREPDNYEDEVEIQCSDPEAAQLLSYALRKLVPMAREAQSSYFATVSENRVSTMGLFKASLVDFKQGNQGATHRLEGECQLSYELLLEEDDEVEDHRYEFFMGDLSPQSVEIEIKGTEVMVTAKTAEGRDYIYVEEEGEQENYEDEISFPVADIPAAKQTQFYLIEAIKGCPDDISPKNYAAVQKIIADAGKAFIDLDLEVEQIDNDPCKWALTLIDEDGDQERYEFNLFDLDPSKVELDVSGKDLEIELVANNKDEIIRNLTNGEETGFEKAFSIPVDMLYPAKVLKVTLQALIETCSQ